MGLDMYLETMDKTSGETTIIHSWRKANQIRAWFVNQFDKDPNDQLKIKLTPETIDNLIFDMTEVLAHQQLASNLLPTSVGFFFGSTDYDEYYFETLADTVDYLMHDLEWHTETEDLYYTEWW